MGGGPPGRGLDGGRPDPDRSHGFGRNPLALLGQADQEMLGTDVGVLHLRGGLVGEDQGGAGSGRESFKHVQIINTPVKMVIFDTVVHGDR